jgi:hypothetical protein
MHSMHLDPIQRFRAVYVKTWSPAFFFRPLFVDIFAPLGNDLFANPEVIPRNVNLHYRHPR